MSDVIGTAAIRITTDGSAVNPAAIEKSMTGAGTRAGSKFKSGFVGSMKGLFVAAGLTGGIVAVGKFFHAAIDGASDLQESTSKATVVFGKQTDAIVKTSKTAATAMGLSQQAYLEATGTLGNLFVALKVQPAAAAAMSQGMVKLAGDLASFNNVSPEDALLAIRAGLVGETEPLRRFGVNLNDVTIREEAVRQGLIKTTKDALTPQTKALAANALIMAQTKTAQGDFKRTSDGLANSQRILKAEVSDLTAQIGTFLLPVVEDIVHWFSRKAVPAISDFVGEMKSGKGQGGDFAAVLGDLKDIAAGLWPELKQAAKFAGTLLGFIADHPEVLALLGAAAVGVKARKFTGGGLTGGIAAAATGPVPVIVTNWAQMAAGGGAGTTAATTAAAATTFAASTGKFGGFVTKFGILIAAPGLISANPNTGTHPVPGGSSPNFGTQFLIPTGGKLPTKIPNDVRKWAKDALDATFAYDKLNKSIIKSSQNLDLIGPRSRNMAKESRKAIATVVNKTTGLDAIKGHAQAASRDIELIGPKTKATADEAVKAIVNLNGRGFDAAETHAGKVSQTVDLIGPHSKAAAATAIAAITGIDRTKVKDKRFKVQAETAAALTSIERLIAAIGRIHDKTFTVTRVTNATVAEHTDPGKDEKNEKSGHGGSVAERVRVEARQTAVEAAKAFVKTAAAYLKIGTNLTEHLAKGMVKAHPKLVAALRKDLRAVAKGNDELRTMIRDRAAMASSVTDSLRGGFSLADTISEPNQFGFGGGTTTFAAVAASVATFAAKARAFTGILRRLVKAGLPRTLIQEVAGLGIVQGTAVGQALLTGSKAQVKALSADWKGISKATSAAGDVVAGAWFDAGIKAQKEFIRGLMDWDLLKRVRRLNNAIKGNKKSGKSGSGASAGDDKVVPLRRDTTAEQDRARTVRLSDADIERLADALAARHLDLTVQVGANNRTKARWYVDGKRTAEAMA